MSGAARTVRHFISSMICLSSSASPESAPGPLPSPVATLARDQIEGAVGLVFLGIVVAEVAAAALLPLERATRDRFRDRQQVVEVECGMPARVVLAMAADADACCPRAQGPRLSRALRISASVRTIPTRSCIISCSAYCT